MKIKKERFLKLFQEQLLTISTLAGVVLGIILGLIVRASSSSQWGQREIMYVKFLGELFLRMLKGLILPLVISSLISAIGTLNFKATGKIGGRAITYYLSTTFIAVILGIILVVTVRPGIDRNQMNSTESAPQGNSKLRTTTTVDTMLDLVRNMFPPNIVQACLEQYQTVLKPSSDNDSNTDINMWKIGHTYGNGMNIIGLVVSAVVLGIAMSSLHGTVNTLLHLVTEVSTIMMKITSWVIFISPIGIFFLTVSQVIEMDDLNVVAGKLGLYLFTVIFGILFHGFIILPIIYYVFTRKNPYNFIFNGMGQAMMVAFGTGSSSATLPVTIKCIEENNGINPQISRFMLPIGATINMDGTALYEAVAAIFIAQLRGIPLSIGKVVAVSITATAAAVGAAGVPQAGLVTLVMVLDAVGLPPEDVSLILAVDWILDRVRTVVNVLGDAIGAGIVDHISKTDLTKPVNPQQGTPNSSYEIETQMET
ncbi:excitatory amino acid transporter 3-like [Contarinia nasturtii]|uniref:excitatory amino acid transporter 3-like n=1 Tax=Contarinia nasturtii TaxID=265458 RepID=UPI0012D3C5DF|nr:excitatory amino acid transporter 3-like [Contarinia nasturtii]XP_031633391.1 excitatory amino acid transporter 3-like [Contarinia nasturtii]